MSKGSWDSIHVIEASPAADGKTLYKLTSTVLLTLVVDRPDTAGHVDLSGSLTKRASSTLPVTADKNHVVNMGTLIEAMESDMRSALDALYLAKTREIVGSLHRRSGGDAGASKGFVADLAAAVKRHGVPMPGMG